MFFKIDNSCQKLRHFGTFLQRCSWSSTYGPNPCKWRCYNSCFRRRTKTDSIRNISQMLNIFKSSRHIILKDSEQHYRRVQNLIPEDYQQEQMNPDFALKVLSMDGNRIFLSSSFRITSTFTVNYCHFTIFFWGASHFDIKKSKKWVIDDMQLTNINKFSTTVIILFGFQRLPTNLINRYPPRTREFFLC